MLVILPVEGRDRKEMQTSCSCVSIYPRPWQQKWGRGVKEMQTSCSCVSIYPRPWQQKWGRGVKEMQTSCSCVFIYPRVWQQQRGTGRKEMQTSCSHVPIYSHYAGYLGVTDWIFGTSIALSSSSCSLDVFTQYNTYTSQPQVF